MTSNQAIVAALRSQRIELPSWAFGNSGHPVQGVRPEGRAARPVREDRRRRPGPPLHRRRADGRPPHPVGQGRRLRRPRPPRRRPAASRLGHDQLEHVPGRRLHARQRLPPRRPRPPEGRRPPARLRRHHGRDRLARPQAVVRRRHELPGPGRHPRPPGPAGRGARRRSTPGSAPDQRMVLEYKLFEPSFYTMDVPDWGTAFAHCLRARAEGEGRASTPATTRPGTNIEFIVASLLRAGQARRVRLQLAVLRRRRPDGRRGRPVPAVPDHARGRAGRRPRARGRRRLHARPVPQHRAEDPRPDPVGDERPGGDGQGAPRRRGRRSRRPRRPATCSAPTPS